MKISLKKILLDFFKYATTPAILLGGVIYFITYVESSKEKQFDNAIDKYKTKIHIENGSSTEQEQRSYILDSINKMHAIKSRKHRDSVLDAILKKQEIADSIALLNADQMYQIKEQLKDLH